MPSPVFADLDAGLAAVAFVAVVLPVVFDGVSEEGSSGSIGAGSPSTMVS